MEVFVILYKLFHLRSIWYKKNGFTLAAFWKNWRILIYASNWHTQVILLFYCLHQICKVFSSPPEGIDFQGMKNLILSRLKQMCQYCVLLKDSKFRSRINWCWFLLSYWWCFRTGKIGSVSSVEVLNKMLLWGVSEKSLLSGDVFSLT